MDTPFRLGNVDPFATPPGQRDPVRRLRGRLALPVTVWTAGSTAEPVGLTVSSVLVAQGDPSVLVGLVDPDSELWETAERTGSFVVHVLGAGQAATAEVFAGIRPAPGGRFRGRAVTDTPYGPALDDVATRVGCRVRSSHAAGWALLVAARIEDVVVGDADDPLVWHHGRFGRLR